MWGRVSTDLHTWGSESIYSYNIAEIIVQKIKCPMLSENTGSDLLDEMKCKELKRFNSSGVNAVEKEIEHVQTKIDEIKVMAESQVITEEISLNFALLKAYKERLERILRAYKMFRLLKVQENYFLKDPISDLLCSYEQEFVKEFSDASDDYLKRFKHLSLGDRNPPLDFYVQIASLQDCGTVMCGDDFIDLKKNRIYFLKKSDIVHLLKKKLVKII